MGNVQEKSALIDSGTHDLQSLQTAGNLFEYLFYTNVENQDRALLIKTKYSLGTPEQVHAQTKSLLKLNELPWAVKLQGYEILKEKHLCHTQSQLFLKFDIPQKNLIDLQKETHVLKDLTENSIWLIIDDLIDYLLDLQIYGLSHGDLRPEFIYLTDLKSVVVLSPLLYTSFKNGYQAQISSENYKSILAPELLTFYVNWCKNLKIDFQKVDIFQISLSILCLLSNKSFEEYYDYQKGEYFSSIAHKDLQTAIKIFGFGEEIKQFLINGLKSDPVERWTLDQMSKYSKGRRQTRPYKFW